MCNKNLFTFLDQPGKFNHNHVHARIYTLAYSQTKARASAVHTQMADLERGRECPSRSREFILQDLARTLQDSFKEDASL